MNYILPWKRKNLYKIWNWPQIFILLFGGWWAEEVSNPKLRFLLTIWRIITLCSVVTGVSSLFFYSIFQVTNGHMSESLAGIQLFSTVIQSTINMFFLVKYRKPLKHAMDLLDEMTKKTENPEDMAVIRSRLTRIWIIFVTIIFTIVFGISEWFSGPVVEEMLHGTRTLIMHDDWPLLINSQTNYIIAYIYESFNGIFIAPQLLLFSSIFICISEYIFCHFRVLQNKFERLHLNRNQIENAKLKDIIYDHIKILQVCRNLRMGSQEIHVMQSILIVVNSCLVLFAFTTEKNIQLYIIIFYTGVFLGLSSTFGLSCWYSSEVMNTCEDFRNAAYMADWTNGNESHKKVLLILMTRTCLPIKFGGFLELSLNTIITVSKATFTYYNFLMAVRQKE